MLVQRYDFGAMRSPATNGAGGAVVPASIARTGIQVYQDADGNEVREYRPAEEVFADASLASLASVPVTVGHPGQVTPANWRSVAVGHVTEAPPARESQDASEWIVANAVISDGRALARVKGRELTEVSMGYTAEVAHEPGVTADGERYDAVQRNIRFNHLALLEPGRARAGSGASLRLDSQGNTYMPSPSETAPEQLVKLDGVEYTKGSDTHVQAMQKRSDAQAAELATANESLGAVQAKLDSANEELAQIKALDVDALIQDAIDFRDRVRPALDAGFEFRGKSREDIQRAVVGPEVSAKIDSLPEAQRSGYLVAKVEDAIAKSEASAKQKADSKVSVISDAKPVKTQKQDAIAKLNAAYANSYNAKSEAE